jgi:hypothetical protein
VPAQFSFASKSEQVVSTEVVSDNVVIYGITGPVVAKVINGSMKIGTGAWVTVDSIVNNGDTIAVKHIGAATPNTSTHTTLNVGGTQAVFTSRTA